MRVILFGVLGAASIAAAKPAPRPLGPSDPAHSIPVPTRPLEWGDVNVLHTTDVHGWISGHSKQNYPEKSWSGTLGDFQSFVIHMRNIAKKRESDLLLVDTGDRRVGHGFTDHIYDPSDHMDGKEEVSLLYHDVGYDLMVPGNHDLEDRHVVKLIMHTLMDYWGDKFLTSNINRIDGKPLGGRDAFSSPKRLDLIKIIPIDQMVEQAWFKDAIKPASGSVDVFVLLGHVDPKKPGKGDDIGLIYEAIRREHPLTPIMLFAGHTHQRWCRTFEVENEDGDKFTRSMLIQSGRYFDTVGWMSVALDNNKKLRDLEFSRRFLDNNIQTYMYHAGIKSKAKFHTKIGKLMTAYIRGAEELAKLSTPLGVLDSDYYLDRNEWTEKEEDKNSLFTFYLNAAETSLINTERSPHWLFFSNWGIVRGDIYSGPFTQGDWYTISPNATDENPFLYITVPRRIADQIVTKVRQMEWNDKYNKDGTKTPPSDMLDITKDQSQSYFSLPSRNADGTKTPPSDMLDITKDQSQSYFSLPSRNPDGLTYGWATQDECGKDDDKADDVRHLPIPRVNFDNPDKLPVYFWRKNYKEDEIEPEALVDIIVTNRVGKSRVPKALKELGDLKEPKLNAYREDVRQGYPDNKICQGKFLVQGAFMWQEHLSAKCLMISPNSLDFS
ncbi:hypothetical protein RSAG8_10343, partial [Rhizoctonia solani AG-8 WAC10335]